MLWFHDNGGGDVLHIVCGCWRLRVVRTRRNISGQVVESRSGVQLMSFRFGAVRMRCVATRRRKCCFCVVVGGCRMVVWSVVGRDMAVRGIRARSWVVDGIPEWYEAVMSFPCVDGCVRMRGGCGYGGRDGELRYCCN